MVDFIKVEHEFIFTNEDISTLKPQETDCLYVVTEDGNPSRWHLIRLVDNNCLNWICARYNNSIPKDIRNFVLDTAKEYPFHHRSSCLHQRGNTALSVIPVHLVLDAILDFRKGKPINTPEEEELPSRFKAIMMELSRE